jgi:uncharacterized protein (DUF1810 family)
MESRLFDLSRFVAAQDSIYIDVLRELRAGLKQSHWMWFIFPQIAGLGTSSFSKRYAIGSLAEARSYLNDAIVGPRLVECTTIVNSLRGRSAQEIFGGVDALKFCSSMTLFELAAPGENDFGSALDKYYDGRRDDATLRLAR